jgi:CBS domain-containing protein
MRISDMPEFRDKTQVHSFEQTTTLDKVIAEMAEKNYGAVLITSKKKLVGIFTERDLLRKVVPQGLNLKKTKVSEVMTSNLKTAKVGDSVNDCMRRMSQGRFRHLPVVDSKKGIVGMLSQGDFVAFTMSDAIARAGSSAKAEAGLGQSSPWIIIVAMTVYTVGLLVVLSGLGAWTGLGG